MAMSIGTLKGTFVTSGVRGGENMSGILLFRIDERLVHGQIVTAWLGHTKANEMIVVDDKTANDSLMSSIIKMVVPPHVSVQVLTIAQTVILLADRDPEDRMMIIVKTPEIARKVLEGNCKEMSLDINMGNSGMAAGRTKITANVYLDESGIQELNRITELGYQVYFQTIPGTPGHKWEDLLKKL